MHLQGVIPISGIRFNLTFIVPVFLKIYTRNLQHINAKLFLLLFLNNFKQICANLQKSENNMMSNDGLIIENMDLSHIHLAVGRPFILKFA